MTKEQIKKLLEKQLELLSQRSETTNENRELRANSEIMINLARQIIAIDEGDAPTSGKAYFTR